MPLLFARWLVDIPSVPGVLWSALSSREGTRSEVPRETSDPLRAGTTEDISRAQSIRRYLLPTWAVLFFPRESAISVLHIYCRGSALISSVVIIVAVVAIVSYTSGLFVVVELSPSWLPHTIYRFYFAVRKAVKRTLEC